MLVFCLLFERGAVKFNTENLLVCLGVHTSEDHFTFQTVVGLDHDSLGKLSKLHHNKDLAEDATHNRRGAEHLVPETELKNVDQTHQKLQNGKHPQEHKVENLHTHRHSL